MFAKENKRKGEKRRGRDRRLGRHVWAESWYRYIPTVFCFGLSVFFVIRKSPNCLYVRYSVKLLMWSFSFLGGVFDLYDGKMASLMTSLQSTETAKQVLYWGHIPCWMKEIWRLRLRKRNTTRPHVKMKKRSPPTFLNCRFVNSWLTPRGPHIYSCTNSIKCDTRGQRMNREDLSCPLGR